MKPILKKQLRRLSRKRRARRNIMGTADRPRLSVFRSHKNIYAQIIDDRLGRTLVAASSMEPPLRQTLADHRSNVAAAAAVGQALAAKAIEAGIKKVVFDRNGRPYHGRLKQLADAARKGGLEF
jgi:large subunit ribosomal protein L18